jgi:signal transduction histidine kinase
MSMPGAPASLWRRFGPWPRSLAGRTALVLLTALAVVQVAGLVIHAYDRIDLQRLAQARDAATRAVTLYRSVAATPPDRRDALIAEIGERSILRLRLDTTPPADPLPPTSVAMRRLLRASMLLVPLPQRPSKVVLLGGPDQEVLVVGMLLNDGDRPWLHAEVAMPEPRPWQSLTFLLAFMMMTTTTAALTLWAVRRLVAPVATLAAAAEALGLDVNAPPLPETGPLEVARAAAAFNTMSARIRRFVEDRTFMLAAIGHDLRTPITRLKLRAEFVEDDELRAKMFADLDELESMVSATLAFGRDSAKGEAATRVDLAALVRTVVDEVGDAHPDAADQLSVAGPEHLPVTVRPVAMKRALTNLVLNALLYGGSARVSLDGPRQGAVYVIVEDEGPGIAAAEIERVFQPFHRIDASRNPGTGGMGLGLPIARNILRAHGGDVQLQNRAGGGLRATMLLPT